MVLSFRLFSVRRVASELAVSVLFLLCAANARAQASRVGATLEGVVSDTTCAVISNAKVELHNPLTNQSRSVSTDGQGFFGQSSLRSVPTKSGWNKRGSHFIGTRESS